MWYLVLGNVCVFYGFGRSGCVCDGVVWCQCNYVQYGVGISIDFFYFCDVDGGIYVGNFYGGVDVYQSVYDCLVYWVVSQEQIMS